MALVPLLALSDVEEDRRIGLAVKLVTTFDVDLVDLLSGPLEKFAVRAHCFPIYSERRGAIVEI